MTFTVLAYLDDLVETEVEDYKGKKHWTFSVGGRDRRSTYEALLAWLMVNGFRESDFFLEPHKNEYFVNKVWLDFFDASEAARFRLIWNAPRTTVRGLDEIHDKVYPV